MLQISIDSKNTVVYIDTKVNFYGLQLRWEYISLRNENLKGSYPNRYDHLRFLLAQSAR